MSLQLDHLVIKVNHLDLAIQSFTQAGFIVTPGGIHKGGFSENALILFSDNSFIELLAIKKGIKTKLLRLFAKTRQFQSLKYSRKWGLFQRFYDRALSLPEGIVDIGLLSDNLPHDLQRIEQSGLFVTRPLNVARKKPDGQSIRWQMAAPLLPELPFIRSNYQPLPQENGNSLSKHKNGVTGIKSVTLLALDFKEMIKNLETFLNISPEPIKKEEPPETIFNLGKDQQLEVKKSSEFDELVAQCRGKGLGSFGVKWKIGTSSDISTINFSNLHGLVTL